MMLELRNITAAYHPDHPILDGIFFRIGKGEKIALLGRNGAGKTTFANVIFNSVPHITGGVLLNDRNIRSIPLERRITMGMGYFMQGAPVFPQMSIKDNLLLATANNTKKFSEKWQQYTTFFPLFRQEGILHLAAGSLSGGERTQLCLAMVLANDPSLLVLDEPFAGLSPGNARMILSLLEEYQSANKASVILIAQDRHMADEFCDKQYFLRNGKLRNE